GVTAGGNTVFSDQSRAVVTLPAGIALTKTALTHQIRRGEEAAFRIEMTNNGNAVFNGLIVLDTLPAGFRYVEGSALLNGVPATPIVTGPEISFSGLQLLPGQSYL